MNLNFEFENLLCRSFERDFCRQNPSHITEVKIFDVFSIQIQIKSFNSHLITTVSRNRLKQWAMVDSTLVVFICTVVLISIGRLNLRQYYSVSDQFSSPLYDNNIPHQVICSKMSICSQPYIYKSIHPPYTSCRAELQQNILMN